MSDDHSISDMTAYDLRSSELSRRQFGALTVGAGVATVVSTLAHAAEVTESDVDIKTPDGTADAYFVHPSRGKSAGVLVWPDVYGLRPTFRDMGKRLAQSGYAVLVVNPFYRTRRAPTAPPHADFDDPPTRQMLLALREPLNETTAITDNRAFIDYLDRQPAVSTRHKMAITGYCMGGPFVFRGAAARPDRVGAGATFHGGGLVTDKPDSPHLLIPQMKARFLIAIAESDDKKQPEAKDTLRTAFAKANLPAEIEVYPGTIHGWCPPDAKVYNPEQAERAWSRMLVLFKTALG